MLGLILCVDPERGCFTTGLRCIMAAVFVVGAVILWYCCNYVVNKQHQSEINEIHAEHHYAKMLELSYKEDAGETLTPIEKMQLEEARQLESAR